MPKRETTSDSRFVQDQIYHDHVNALKLTITQALYQRALKVRSAVPHPKIMGIIRECGGKMHMSEGNRSAPRMQGHTMADNYQRTGRKLKATFSSRSATMTKPDRCNESRS